MTITVDDELIQIETSEKLTIVGQNFTNRQDVITALAGLMCDFGYVKSTYPKAVLDREEKMPTGLQTQAYGIAIPHSDPEYVDHSAMAVALLEKPVLFRNMANPEEDVGVNLVLLLAISDKNQVTKVLARLAEAFLSPEVLNHFLTMKTSQQLSACLSDLIHGRLAL